MSSICFSLATNLRCANFDKRDSILLSIPTFVEFVFSVTLALNPKEAKRNWLLVVESWSYIILTIVDLLLHTVPALQTSLPTFKALDIIVGVGTSFPVIALALFLFLLVTALVTPELSQRLRLFVTCSLMASILAITILDEISSFLGISYRIVRDQTGRRLLEIGFLNSRDEDIWSFFSSFTLVYFAIYQAISFLLIVYHLMRVYLEARRAERIGRANEVHRVRGLGWLVVGLKLGAVETVIGFASSTFGRSFTRRLFRLLSRACLIIGVMKGTNTIEDVSFFREIDGSRKRGAGRLSRLFFNNFRVEKSNAAPMDALGASRRQRVTVEYSRQKGPVLQMRFSDLELPDPSNLMNEMYHKDFRRISTQPSTVAAQTGHEAVPDTQPLPHDSRLKSSGRRRFSYLRYYSRGQAGSKSRDTAFSNEARRSDSLHGVDQLISEFPPTPHRPDEHFLHSVSRALDPSSEDISFNSVSQRRTDTSDVARSLSGKRKPVPRLSELYIENPNTDFRETDYVPPSSVSGPSTMILNRRLVGLSPRRVSIQTAQSTPQNYASPISMPPFSKDVSPLSQIAGDMGSPDSIRTEYRSIETEIKRVKSERSLNSVKSRSSERANVREEVPSIRGRVGHPQKLQSSKALRSDDTAGPSGLAVVSQVRVRSTPKPQQQDFARESLAAEQLISGTPESPIYALRDSVQERLTFTTQSEGSQSESEKGLSRIDSTTLGDQER